jgi:hypothetical protein
MTALAARLDPCVNWFKLVARTRGRILWAFPAALFVGYLVSVNWPGAFAALASSRDDRSANVSDLTEARRLDLGYGAVLANPAAAVGKPVTWCVDSFDGAHGFVQSRQTDLVLWTNPSPELKSDPGAYGYCVKTLAVVEGVEAGVVRLRLLEKL